MNSKKSSNKANQYGPSIINDPKKVKVIIRDAKNLSRKEMLEGKGEYKVSRKILDKLKASFGLVYGKKANRKRISINQIYKLSTKENIQLFESNLINEDIFRSRGMHKGYRDKMSPLQKKIYDKKKYSELTEKQLVDKRKRNKKYIDNLSGEKLEKRKISENKRAKKRWASMSEAQKIIKRKRDRIWQKNNPK